jgi:hypothetical protein
MDETARMPIEERQARRTRDIDYLTSTASEWTRYIIKEVLSALDDETFTVRCAPARPPPRRRLPEVAR